MDKARREQHEWGAAGAVEAPRGRVMIEAEPRPKARRWRAVVALSALAVGGLIAFGLYEREEARRPGWPKAPLHVDGRAEPQPPPGASIVAEDERARRAQLEAALEEDWEAAAPKIKQGGPEGVAALEAFEARWAREPIPNPHLKVAWLFIERASSPASTRREEQGLTWISISGGHFMMGSEHGYSDEAPRRQVEVDDFWISQSEVTVGQYRRCVKDGACPSPDAEADDEYCNWAHVGRVDQPMNCVSWSEARAFAAWVRGRLPTEEEWEYAARGRGRDIEYPWGSAEATCDLAVMGSDDHGCGEDQTWIVCSKPSGNTAQDLCDMAGNVWEWVVGTRNARGEVTGARIPRIRGGSWLDRAFDLRASNRLQIGASTHFVHVGFRVAR